MIVGCNLKIVVTYNLYSLLGQKVMHYSPQQKSPSINVSSRVTGVYLMKVDVDGQNKMNN